MKRITFFIVACVRCNHPKSRRTIKCWTMGGAIRRASAQCTCNYPKDDVEAENK